MNDDQVRCVGVEHMDAGQNIGGCVSPVQKAYHSDENIIPFKLRGSQQVSVGIEGGHNQEQCHTGIEEYNIFVKVFPVFKEQPDENGSNVSKPEKIGDDKIFTEWDEVIQWEMDHMVGQALPILEPDKPCNVYCKIQDCPCMRIVF